MPFSEVQKKRGQFWTLTKICKTFLFGLSKRSLVKIPIFFLVKIIFYAIFRSAEKMGSIFDTHTLDSFKEGKLGILL